MRSAQTAHIAHCSDDGRRKVTAIAINTRQLCTNDVIKYWYILYATFLYQNCEQLLIGSECAKRSPVDRKPRCDVRGKALSPTRNWVIRARELCSGVMHNTMWLSYMRSHVASHTHILTLTYCELIHTIHANTLRHCVVKWVHWGPGDPILTRGSTLSHTSHLGLRTVEEVLRIRSPLIIVSKFSNLEYSVLYYHYCTLRSILMDNTQCGTRQPKTCGCAECDSEHY